MKCKCGKEKCSCKAAPKGKEAPKGKVPAKSPFPFKPKPKK